MIKNINIVNTSLENGESLYEAMRWSLSDSATITGESVVNREELKKTKIGNELLVFVIVQEELKGRDRAEYGAQVIKKLSARITDEFGKGFGYRDLYRCKSVYNAF